MSKHKTSELQQLRDKAELNDLRIKVAQQEAGLRLFKEQKVNDILESYYEPDNYVDPRDYIGERRQRFGAPATSINDRQDGRNVPVFQTEGELQAIRGIAEYLANYNHIAVGALRNLKNYVIGTTSVVKASTKKGASPELVATTQKVLDEFTDDNDWQGLAKELFNKSRRVGEFLLRLQHVGEGHVKARTVEPDQITEPGNKRGLEEWLGCDEGSWSFGVHTDPKDTEDVHGYYVQWSARSDDWDYIPGGNRAIIPPDWDESWLEHYKTNVDRKVKRGLSDLFSVAPNIELVKKLLRAVGEGATIQASIAWVKKMAAGVSQSQAIAQTLASTDEKLTSRTSVGTKTSYAQNIQPGTVLVQGPGQSIEPGPMGAQHAPNYINVLQALYRAIGVIWAMPEGLISGDSSNNNYASSLVAEGPFVKMAEAMQEEITEAFLRIFWRVLWFAWRAGRFGNLSWEQLEDLIEVVVTLPQVAVRDKDKETTRRKILYDSGLMSLKTWSAEENLDYDQEQAQRKQEQAGRPLAETLWGSYP